MMEDLKTNAGLCFLFPGSAESADVVVLDRKPGLRS